MAEVSVIIPVYNTEPFLKDCLESVANQTFRDFEVIVIDDGSTDRGLALAEKFAKRDSRFKVFHQENRGLSGARNTGIEKASAPWITFLDSDDLWHPQFLERLTFAMKNISADVYCCAKQSFKGSPVFKEYPLRIETHEVSLIKKCRLLEPRKALRNSLYQNDSPDYSAWNKIYRASLWQNRRFIEGIYFEDFATIPSIFLDSERVVFLREPLYLYRKRETSILATSYTLKKAELLDIAERTFEQFKNENDLRLAAKSMLVSASFSILMRTPDTDEFKDYRDRAWNWIRAFRLDVLLNSRTRLRNKVAAFCSLGGKTFAQFCLRRFG